MISRCFVISPTMCQLERKIINIYQTNIRVLNIITKISRIINFIALFLRITSNWLCIDGRNAGLMPIKPSRLWIGNSFHHFRKCSSCASKISSIRSGASYCFIKRFVMSSSNRFTKEDYHVFSKVFELFYFLEFEVRRKFFF